MAHVLHSSSDRLGSERTPVQLGQEQREKTHPSVLSYASSLRTQTTTNHNSFGTLIMSIEARIKELGLTLPTAPAAAGTYSPVVIIDNLAYVSGQGPMGQDGTLLRGRVGDDVTEEEGIFAARTVGLTMLATIKAQLGSLDRVKRIVKVLGMVNSTADFQNHPKVINGFSDLMVEIWGEEGRAARSAVGMGSLPGNITVEIEAILELTE